MVLIHDLVEIDAGDAFCYDAAAQVGKAAKEQAAAERIFALLPADQEAEFRGIWQEFEAGTGAEARFARALDRFQPLLLHQLTNGEAWRRNQIAKHQVMERMAEVRDHAPALWPPAEAIIDRAVA